MSTGVSNTPSAILLYRAFSPILTLWRLTAHIGVVPHRWPLKLHFIYLFNKYRYRIFLTWYILSVYFPLQNAVCFIILTYLVPVLFTFYIQGVLKLKKNNSGAKSLKQLPTQSNPALSLTDTVHELPSVTGSSRLPSLEGNVRHMSA